MNKKAVGYGIIGIGNMGTEHVKFINNLKNSELIAVCDIDPDAFERIDEKTRERIQCYTCADDLFKNPDVEVVLIAVPHYDHPDLAIAAMEHGKHIIVEKPIAVHKAEAQRLIDAAKNYPNLVKSAMFCQRTIPAHIKIKNMIDSGELGQIRRVNWTVTDWFRSQYYYDSGDWRASWRGEGGGVLLNQCPHQLDLMQWFFGMPTKVRATAKLGKFHDIEVEDEVNAYLEYADGKVANFITTTGEAPGTNRLEIAAERGRVIMEKGTIQFLRNETEMTEYSMNHKGDFSRPEYWECNIPVKKEARPMHQIIIENVSDAILKGTALIAPMEEGIRGLELGNAMLLSGLTDTTVEMPMDAAVYAEMLQKLIATSKYQKKAAPVKKEIAAGFSSSY